MAWATGSGFDARIPDYIEAIDCIINIADEDAVGIGRDFTQGQPDEFMRAAGWPDSHIGKIMGENWLRLLDAVWS
jgi:membrane dipeptidase